MEQICKQTAENHRTKCKQTAVNHITKCKQTAVNVNKQLT